MSFPPYIHVCLYIYLVCVVSPVPLVPSAIQQHHQYLTHKYLAYVPGAMEVLHDVLVTIQTILVVSVGLFLGHELSGKSCIKNNATLLFIPNPLPPPPPPPPAPSNLNFGLGVKGAPDSNKAKGNRSILSQESSLHSKYFQRSTIKGKVTYTTTKLWLEFLKIFVDSVMNKIYHLEFVACF